MEPLFVNEMRMDAAMMTDYYRVAYNRARVRVVEMVVFSILCLAYSAWCLTRAAQLGSLLFLALGIAGLGVLALFLWRRLTAPARLVKRLLKKDKGRNYPLAQTVKVYAGRLVAGSGAAAPPGGENEDSDSTAAPVVPPGEETSAAPLPDAAEEASVRRTGEYPLGMITDYFQTGTHHALVFGSATVMLSFNGFTTGSDRAFRVFLRGRVEAARNAAADAKVRKALDKALGRYFDGIAAAETPVDTAL